MAAAVTPPQRRRSRPASRRPLDAVVAKPMYAHSVWGYEVVDQATGEILLPSNADKSFVTGSILKIYSTATALDVLGPAYRFRTPVHRRGRVSAGVLRGDLVLVASGDFSFGLREHPGGTSATTTPRRSITTTRTRG